MNALLIQERITYTHRHSHIEINIQRFVGVLVILENEIGYRANELIYLGDLVTINSNTKFHNILYGLKNPCESG